MWLGSHFFLSFPQLPQLPQPFFCQFLITASARLLARSSASSGVSAAVAGSAGYTLDLNRNPNNEFTLINSQ